MKIKRFVNGKEQEFELTSDELYAAFSEQEFKFDRADVADYFSAFDNEYIEEEYGMTAKEVESKFNEIAYEMRRNIDKYDMEWTFARDEAIETILRREVQETI